MKLAQQLVAQHKGKGQLVDLYGVILFTDAHPNLSKVLKDEYYWRSFDEISGQRWAIFSVKPKQGRMNVPKLKGGMIGLMVATWDEPKENKPLIEEFDIDSTRELPTLLIFTWDQVSPEALKITIQLDDSSLEAAYTSLRESIRRVTDVVERTDPAFRANSVELYNLVKNEELNVKSVKLIKKMIPFSKWVLKVFGS